MSDFRPVRGWPAQVVSKKLQFRGTDLPYEVGRLRVLPYWEQRVKRISGLLFSLDPVLYVAEEDLAIQFNREIKINDFLFVTGDFYNHSTLGMGNRLQTLFWMDEYAIDSSKCTQSGLSGKLISSNSDEFTVAADRRLSVVCPHCGSKTVGVAGSFDRFCPPCEA